MHYITSGTLAFRCGTYVSTYTRTPLPVGAAKPERSEAILKNAELAPEQAGDGGIGGRIHISLK